MKALEAYLTLMFCCQVLCGYGEDPKYGNYWIVRNSWVRFDVRVNVCTDFIAKILTVIEVG